MGNEYNSNSIAPGWPVLFATTAYTAICITVGFLFICRKKKWGNKDNHSKSRSGDDGEFGSPTTNPSQARVDPTPYMCPVDEVIGNTFFDQERIDDLDDNSIESNDSNKAYEYFFGQDGKNENITSEEVEAEMSYELFADGNRGNSGNGADKSMELSNVIIENSPESRSVESDDAQSQTNKPLAINKIHLTNRSFVLVDIMGNPVHALTPEVRLASLEDREKKTESRRFLGRKSRSFRVKKRKRKTGSNRPKSKAEKLSTSNDKSTNADRSVEGNDTYQKEMNEINKLAIPWTISSFIEHFASMLTIALISSYMSVAAMICYSYVWFILGAAFMFSGALYNSLYKHVNNSIALETEKGNVKAGKYIRISIIVNTIISVPVSIGMIFAMGPIMKFYGFGDGMVELCSTYTYIAVIHNFASTTAGFISIATDINGFADFNAKYALCDGLVNIAISAFIIPFGQPSLAQLGLIYFAIDVVSHWLYYYLTWYKWDLYCDYKKGMQAPITYDRQNKKALSTLIKKSIPLLFDELNGELEWLVSAYFASFLGNAESASWILLSYIWGLVGVVPSCIGSAAESRVSHQLSKGNIEVAKQVSNRCMFLTGITSVVGTNILFLFRKPVIHFITSDNDLEYMLMGVMPYILFCQPMVSLTTTGAYLNRALAMYQRSTKIELLVTCLVTLPLAGVSTFVFGYNISGLAAASFIGYATMGLVILAIYNNADWEKAVRKNKKIAGEVESSKLNTGVEVMDTQEDAKKCSFKSIEVVGALV